MSWTNQTGQARAHAACVDALLELEGIGEPLAEVAERVWCPECLLPTTPETIELDGSIPSVCECRAPARWAWPMELDEPSPAPVLGAHRDVFRAAEYALRCSEERERHAQLEREPPIDWPAVYARINSKLRAELLEERHALIRRWLAPRELTAAQRRRDREALERAEARRRLAAERAAHRRRNAPPPKPPQPRDGAMRFLRETRDELELALDRAIGSIRTAPTRYDRNDRRHAAMTIARSLGYVRTCVELGLTGHELRARLDGRDDGGAADRLIENQRSARARVPG